MTVRFGALSLSYHVYQNKAKVALVETSPQYADEDVFLNGQKIGTADAVGTLTRHLSEGKVPTKGQMESLVRSLVRDTESALSTQSADPSRVFSVPGSSNGDVSGLDLFRRLDLYTPRNGNVFLNAVETAVPQLNKARNGEPLNLAFSLIEKPKEGFDRFEGAFPTRYQH